MVIKLSLRTVRRGGKDSNGSPLTCSNRTDMAIVMFFCEVVKKREESEVVRG